MLFGNAQSAVPVTEIQNWGHQFNFSIICQKLKNHCNKKFKLFKEKKSKKIMHIIHI